MPFAFQSLAFLTNDGVNHPNGSELVVVQCDQIRMYDSPKCSCWGFYYQTMTPQAGSRR